MVHVLEDGADFVFEIVRDGSSAFPACGGAGPRFTGRRDFLNFQDFLSKRWFRGQVRGRLVLERDFDLFGLSCRPAGVLRHGLKLTELQVFSGGGASLLVLKGFGLRGESLEVHVSCQLVGLLCPGLRCELFQSLHVARFFFEVQRFQVPRFFDLLDALLRGLNLRDSLQVQLGKQVRRPRI